jgi:hypothetical protein
MSRESCGCHVDYSAGTLTIVAQQGEAIDIYPERNGPETGPGFVRVLIGGNAVFASAADRPVQDLVVKPGTAISYSVIINADVTLHNVTVHGAFGGTYLAIYPRSCISENLNFIGHPSGAGVDVFDSYPGSFVGGNTFINLKSEASDIRVNAGVFAGDLTILGDIGKDRLTFAQFDHVAIGGNLDVGLRGGSRHREPTGRYTVSVGKSVV